MKHLVIKRNKDFGQLIYMGKLICFTIDPHKLTPGLYNLKLNYSTKFKTNLPLLYNEDFGEERGFRIHAGNTLKDSNGCILVGTAIDTEFKLMNSRTALSNVLDILRESDIWLVSIIGE